jgi:hypothetical protein
MLIRLASSENGTSEIIILTDQLTKVLMNRLSLRAEAWDSQAIMTTTLPATVPILIP